MVSHDVICRALRNAMIELRASAPCTEAQIAGAILTQTVGVDQGNADEAARRVMDLLRRQRIVQRYEGTDAWEIHRRLYDANGRLTLQMD